MENNLWIYGENEYGQLGLGDDMYRNDPTQISNLKTQQVAA
jgi:hypothetical protein